MKVFSLLRSSRRRKSRRDRTRQASRTRQAQRGVEALEPRMVLSAASVTAFLGSAVDGVVNEHATDTSGGGSIVNGTVVPQSAYPAVGQVITNQGLCSGTLVGPHHVLTAKHCTGTNPRFFLGGSNYTVIEQIEHPSDDIAIMILSSDVAGVTPRDILRTNPSNGETLTLVGYGDHGTTNNPISGFGTLREGHTPLQFTQSDLIGWVFNGDGESSHSFGDSGGPAFVDRGGELVIAGVASFVTGDPNTPGTQGWDVRVDAFETWIDNIIASPEPPLPFEADAHQSAPGPGSTLLSVEGDNAWATGAIETSSDEDAFEFTLNDTTDVTITVVGTDGRLDPEIRLHDAGLTPIAYNNDISGSSNTNSQITMTLGPGTYYFTVAAFLDANVGWYSAAIDLSPNPGGDQHIGNVHPLATDITPNGDGEIALRETLESAGDRDVFEFVVDQTSTVQLAATAADGTLNPRLQLFDSEGTEIANNDDVSSPDETDSYFFATIDPGTYFVRVLSSSALTAGDYVLTIDGAIGPQTAIPGDFNGDDAVDGDDFLIWQSSFNVDNGGDADDDGDTDGDDFLVWQSNFGTASGAAAVGRPVLPPNGGVIDFSAWDPRPKDKARGAADKQSKLLPERLRYKRTKVYDSGRVDLSRGKLPKLKNRIYLNTTPTTQHDSNDSIEKLANERKTPTDGHDTILAHRSNWLSSRIVSRLK